MRLLWNNLVDDYSSPSYSSQEPSLPASNVRHAHLSRPWRTTDVSAQYYTIDAGVGNTITATCAAIIGKTPYTHNLTSGVTAKIQAHTSDSWGTPDLDQAITYDADHMIVFFSSTEKRFWRFYFDDGGNGDGYLSIPRLFLGTYYQVTDSFQKGFTEERVSNTVFNQSLSGQVYADEGDEFRRFALEFPYWSDTEKQAIAAIIKNVAKKTPIVALLDENNTDKLAPLYCLISEDPAYPYIHQYDWRGRFVLQEVF